MAITYRTLKGSPLSAQELDQNFRELSTRVSALEEGLSGSSSSLPAPTLPRFQARGAWQAARAYAVYDMCFRGRSIYICRSPHTSASAFTADQNRWASLLELPELEGQVQGSSSSSGSQST